MYDIKYVMERQLLNINMKYDDDRKTIFLKVTTYSCSKTLFRTATTCPLRHTSTQYRIDGVIEARLPGSNRTNQEYPSRCHLQVSNRFERHNVFCKFIQELQYYIILH